VATSPGGGQDAAAGSGSGTAGAPGAAGAGQAGASAAGASGAAGSTGDAGAGAAGAGNVGGSLGGAAGAGGAGPFTLKTPLDGDPTVSATPTLTWTASVNAARYIVEIATEPTFATDVQSGSVGSGITATSFTLTDGLAPGVIYYWRVGAVSHGEVTYASNGPFAMSSPVTAGPSPHGVAVTPDGKQAVITNDKPSGSVTLLDLAAFTTQTIALTGQPAMVAVTPDGSRALVAEGSPNDVAILDLVGKNVAGKVSPPCVGTTLYGIAVAPDGTVAVLPDFNAGCTKDVLDVVALPGAALNSYDLGTSGSALGVAVTPNSATALVTRGILATSVKRVELATGALTTIPNTSASFGVAVAPGGAEALVSSGEGDTIKRISLASNTVTGMITFETNQDEGNLAIAPSGKLAVAVGDFKIGIINLADGSVARSFSLTGRSVAVTPDSKRALVTGAGATGKVYVVPLP
jgi:DNA-binding beta-propeller fold protein YncE